MLHELLLQRGLKGEKVFHRDLRPNWDCSRSEAIRAEVLRNHPVSAGGTDTPPG